jgi:recombinational DNA repair protein (RecF pathway)
VKVDSSRPAATSTSRATSRTASVSARCAAPTTRINAGYAVVEVVDAIPSDDVADEGIFELLARVLVTLDDESFDPLARARVVLLQLSPSTVQSPVVDRCVNCGRPGPLVAFNAQVGGTLCAECRQGPVDLAPRGAHSSRMLGGELASVLRDAPPPGAGEVMAHCPRVD